MAAVCPECGDGDHIQKVTAIYDAGMSEGHYEGTLTSLATTKNRVTAIPGTSTGRLRTATILAKKLAPPAKPAEPRLTGRFAGGMLVAIASGILLILSLAGVIGDRQVTYAEGASYPILSFLPEGAVMVYGMWMALNAIIEKKTDDQEYQRELMFWQEQMNEWNCLYYCHKHDIMFNPDDGVVYTFVRND